MSRRKQTKRKNKRQPQPQQRRVRNSTLFRELLDWFVPQGELFAEDEFHGNVRWNPDQVAAEALIWSWQEAKNVTDAFDQALEICEDLEETKGGKQRRKQRGQVHLIGKTKRPDPFNALSRPAATSRRAPPRSCGTSRDKT